MAYGSRPIVMPKKKAPLVPKKKAPVKKAPVRKGKISKAMLERLLVHSKMHKGGMSSKHMRLMIRFVKQGDSFNKAHEKAKKLD